MSPAHCLECAAGALKSDDFTFGHDLDIALRADALDKVARHRRFEAAATHHQPHLGDPGGEKYCGLPGRIAGTHQGDILPGTELGFQWRRPVMDRRPFEPGELAYIAPPIPRPTPNNNPPPPH